MATNSVNFGMLDPSVVVDQAAIERNMELAAALRQSSLTPVSTQGRMMGNIAYKVSPFEGLAKLLQGYTAGQLNQQNDTDRFSMATRQSNLIKALLGGGANDPSTASTAALTQGAMASPPVAGADGSLTNTGGLGPTNDNAQRMASILSSQPQQGSPQPQGAAPQTGPLSLSGNPGTDLAALSIAPDAYMSTLLDKYKKTELQKDTSGLSPGDQTFAVQTKYLPPVNMRGHVGLVPDGNGGWKPQQASVDAITAEKTAESPFAPMVKIPTSNGSEISLSQPEYVQWQKSGQLPMRLLPPAVQQGIRTDTDKTDPSAPANVRYQIPGAGTVTGQIPPSLGVSPSTFDKSLSEQEAGRVNDNIKEVETKGVTAIQKVASNNQMVDLLPQITTGPLNKQITLVKNIASSLGVNLGDPAPNQEFEKYAIQGALGAAKQIYGSRITNQDVTTQITSNPGATMTEKAIYQLLKYDNELQQQHIQKLSALQDYRNKGMDLRQFEPWFAQTYPYHGVTAPAAGAAQDFRVMTPPMPQKSTDNRRPLDSIFQGN